ncbi:lamin tail domain-containing protein [Halobacterium wangiae]|uniref:lamin tail domain-containing protein n=1 Tax=Halobacterium wangiae TaxID=2902623 RepID=UPI001E28D006|nr:lamin tail domain-containing protein [Halobacterium wangiae]
MRRRLVALALALLLVAAAGCVGTDPAGSPSSATTPASGTNGTLEVHFVNVGQASATLVVGPSNETMLVDTGDWRDDGDEVLDYLRAQNVDRIDYLITTHADADHIGGNAAVIDYYETEADGVGAVYDPGLASASATYENYLDAVERHDVALYETRAGDAIPLDAATVEVLSPPRPYLADDEQNENSVVLDVTFGNTSFLLTGDAGEVAERRLVETDSDELNATVLQASHHGSDSSSSAPFLDAVDPSAVVVSSAYDSQYGHPDEAVLERLAERNHSTYWTATHGDVVTVSDGENVTVYTQQAAPTDAARLRDGDPVEPGDTTAVTERARLDGSGVHATTASTPVTDGGTTTGTTAELSTDLGLVVETVHADAQGDDRDNLNDEYVVFENAGDDSLDLSGWTVGDEADHSYTVPEGVTLDPGTTVTLYTGSGTDSATELYWGADAPVWNNDGDTVFVRTDDGELVVEEAY